VAYACEQDMLQCIFIKEYEDFVMEKLVELGLLTCVSYPQVS